mmetsp:Transcript_14187/g.29760  ORF Transcript_14187/g.29760 Transcript_14187/m.29760 type:complete len:236 (-) Transcript_14187:412-1119(-)
MSECQRMRAGIMQHTWNSDQVSNVVRHLFDLRVVEPLQVLHGAHVVVRDKVDCDAFPAKPPAAPDAMQVILHVPWKVVVDHEGHLLHVDAAREQVCRDEHARRARPKFAHDQVALLLIQFRVHGRNGEVALRQLVLDEVDLAARVAVDDALGDRQRLVQVDEGVDLPLLLLDGHVELPDTLERQLVLLHEDPDRVAHELGGHLQDLRSHGGGEEAHLDVGRQALEDVVDLVLEPA